MISSAPGRENIRQVLFQHRLRALTPSQTRPDFPCPPGCTLDHSAHKIAIAFGVLPTPPEQPKSSANQNDALTSELKLTRHIGRTAGEKEGILLLGLAELSQLLQIQHLADGNPPQREQVLVVEPVLVRRPGFKGRGVAADGAEVVVVQEVDHLLGLLDAHKGAFGRRDVAQVGSLGQVHLVVRVDPAGADEQDVAVLEREALLGGAVEEPLQCDSIRRVGVVLLLRIFPVVDQDSSTDCVWISSVCHWGRGICSVLTNAVI